MKLRAFLLLLTVGLFSLSSLHALESTPKEEMKLPETSIISRAFGHLIAKNLKESPGYQFDLQKVISGIEDEMQGKPSPMTDDDYEQAISLIQKKYFDEMANENLLQANEFLEQNAQVDGVTEIVPGKLQVSILKEGEGPGITEENTPLVHYTGRYLDETVFGTSDKMEPIALELNETIPGFKQGLLGAKAGESRRLYIHPEFGYGDSGLLLPNALMIFDIEVLETHAENPVEPAS